MAKTIAVFTATLVVAIAIADPIEFDLSSPPCELKPLLATLESKRPVRSEFEEIRSNPFQKRPRRFSGIMFWHPDYGLSLEYTSPGSTKININTRLITIYRKDNPTRRIDYSPDDPGLAVFIKLFAWDTDWIGKNFTTVAEMKADHWEIQLRPLQEGIGNKFSRIELRGKDDLMESIKLDLPGGREIKITLNNQQIPWEPEQAILENQFLKEDDWE